MKRAIMNIKITGAEKPDRVKVIVERALVSGFILNSVKTDIEYSLVLGER